LGNPEGIRVVAVQAGPNLFDEVPPTRPARSGRRVGNGDPDPARLFDDGVLRPRPPEVVDHLPRRLQVLVPSTSLDPFGPQGEAPVLHRPPPPFGVTFDGRGRRPIRRPLPFSLDEPLLATRRRTDVCSLVGPPPLEAGRGPSVAAVPETPPRSAPAPRQGRSTILPTSKRDPPVASRTLGGPPPHDAGDVPPWPSASGRFRRFFVRDMVVVGGPALSMVTISSPSAGPSRTTIFDPTACRGQGVQWGGR